MLKIDPDVFRESAIAPETKELNAKIIAQLEAGPDPWSFDPEIIRQARRDGKGIFPFEEPLPDARNFEIDGPNGPIELREIKPDLGEVSGVFLHIHGGGWRLGAFDQQDHRLKRLANATGLTCLSVEYRLAPEHPYPQGPHDCARAAHWLATEAGSHYNTKFLAIGGESAGAHLSVASLLYLRENHDIQPFQCAILIAGCYDMASTPSARRFGLNRLVLTTRDIDNFGASFLQNNEDRGDPDVSPIHADLSQMPPAFFTVGTKDALLDDTLFMASRWVQSQPETELEIAPGGCHMFQFFSQLEIAQQSLYGIESFIKRQLSRI